MPPSQRLLASKLRGYVCRSCLLKLQKPLQRLPQWHSRSVRTRTNSYSKSTGPNKNTPPKGTVRYFEENEAGERTESAIDFEKMEKELGFDELPEEERPGNDEEFNELWEEKLEELEEESGVPREMLGEYFDLERLYDDCWAALDAERGDPDDPSNVLDPDEESPDAGDSQTDRLQAIMKSLPSIEELKTLPKEERLRVREILFSHYDPSQFDGIRIASSTSVASPEAETINSDSSSGDSPPRINTDSSPSEQEETKSNLSSAKSPLTTSPISSSLKNDDTKPDASLGVVNEGVDLDDLPPFHRNIRVEQLNIAIRNMRKSKRDHASQKYVWRSYLQCRTSIGTLSAISTQAWVALWKAFTKKFTISNKSIIDPSSWARLKILGDDMTKVEGPLQPSWRLLYIESVFVDGQEEQALSMWEAIKPKDQDISRLYLEDYWNLGIMMYCRQGRPDEALQVADLFLMDSQDPLDFRILFPIIEAYLALKEKRSTQTAWALYIRIRVNMGLQLTMEDYDTLAASFLEANKPNLALGIFTDMMLTGDPSAAKEDSTAQYRAAIRSDMDLKSLKIRENELNLENLRILANLPKRFENKFFYGSWIKKLIGEGNLDAAHKIFELMQQKRIKPDARHMNGLIGAWFREGTEKSRIKAEAMAWEMINVRLEFIERRRLPNLEYPLQPVESWDKPDFKRAFLIPSATIETFSVLLQQYRQRQKPDLALDLFSALRKAEVLPNTSFMNQLLLTDMRAHETDWAWTTYYSLTKSGQVHPDFETYTILWALMKRASDPAAGSKPDTQRQGFTTCRRLFADMMAHASKFNRKEKPSRELYELIILSFSLAQDQVGTAVAMYGLQKCFNMFPSQETGRTIIFQLARLGLVNKKGRKPRRFAPTQPRSQERITAVAHLLQKFKDDRAQALREQGIVYEDLEGDDMLEETMIVLSDLLRYAATVRITSEERFNYNAVVASSNAAEQMGVPECSPWRSYSSISEKSSVSEG